MIPYKPSPLSVLRLSSAHTVLGKTSLIAGLMIAASMAFGDDADKSAEAKVFKLGTLEVYGDKPQAADQLPVRIDAATIDLLEKKDLSQALAALPGVTLTRFGGRNETAVYVRGFARNQVPLFVDGIPVYVPYDGIIDLGRFMTYDVAAVSVSKGYSSALFGPNTMGGAINVSTRQPTSTFEGQLEAGAFTGDGYEGSVNIGTRQKKWYAQLGASYVEQDHYELSDHFVPVASEDGGARENSYRQDHKISAKVAFTPNATDEYAIGYIRQNGEKGNPPQTTSPKYWYWPQWDKETVYVISNTKLGETTYLKPRLYYDTYDNTLGIFDDATYSTQAKSSSSTSIYNEYTYGGSLEAGTSLIPTNTLKGIAHYKFDHHKERPDIGRKPTTSYVDEDRSLSFGLEDTQRFNASWEAQIGASYDKRKTDKAIDTTSGAAFPTKDFSSFNPEAALFYKIDSSNTLHASVARKSRFPSMKERFSYRMGSGLPNPDLKDESALHYELGYEGRPSTTVTVQAAVYGSRIEDTIQNVYTSHASTVSQFQNIGTSEKYGADLGLGYAFADKLSAGGTYSYIYQKTLTTLPKNTEPVKATDVPRQTGSLYLDYRPLAKLSIVPSLEYSSWRYSYSDGKGVTRTVGGFTLVDFKLSYRALRGLTLSVGVQNLFDKNYVLQEGYPEAGRSWYANARYEF